MKYATYSNLQRAGYIIIEVNGGVIQDVWKPDNDTAAQLTEWNGKVVVLDFDVTDEDDPAYTEITDIDGTKRLCYYTEW